MKQLTIEVKITFDEKYRNHYTIAQKNIEREEMGVGMEVSWGDKIYILLRNYSTTG